MAKGFDDVWLEQLKAKNDIVSTISKYLQLEHKGKNFWACCPFHHEKTPSFCIYPYEQVYHCYGCKEHGNVITFIQKMESCSFVQAVEILAKSAGMELPNFEGDENIALRKKQKEIMLNVLNLCAKHYEENLYLKTSTIPQEYIKKRGLNKKDLDKFHLGYSKNWNELVDYLKSQGISLDDMKLAGVVEEKNGRPYDVMGERLIFPIYNIYDECIGFSARSLVQTSYAKYKNSTNSLVFDKSRTLYSLNNVKKAKQQESINYIVVVEGQMDVIAMSRAGFNNAVACLGTALTPEHARMLKYICSNVILCLDGDSAGQKASMRTVDTLVSAGLNVKAVKLPENKDPDEYIKAYGKESMQKQLDNAMDYVEFKIKNKLEQYNLTKNDEKAKFVNTALDIIKELDTNSEKEIYLEIIKKLSGVPIDVLKRDLQTDKPTIINDLNNDDNVNEDAEIKAIKFVLASLCYKKEFADYSVDISKYLINPTYKQLYDLLKNYHDNNKTFLISTLYDVFDVENETNLQDIIDYDFGLINSPEKYYLECIKKIRETFIKSEIDNLKEQYNKTDDMSARKEIAYQIMQKQKLLRNRRVEE